MIPRDYVTAWRTHAPWVQDAQVEQDLVLSRALVEIFSHPVLAEGLAMRGGTAIYKLYLQPPARYSEDIDLVQLNAGPAGPLMDALREVLNPWLGVPRWKQTEGRVTFVYRFDAEGTPPLPLRLKLEINSREHFSAFQLARVSFVVESRWFAGHSEVVTYELDELLGTKLRALYQRRKGRDLFDLATVLEDERTNPQRIVAAFQQYMDHGNQHVTRALFEQDLAAKLSDPRFAADIGPLLSHGYVWDIERGAQVVLERLGALLPGKLRDEKNKHSPFHGLLRIPD